jgi:Ca2+-binding RTX toxin-like protein
MRRAVLLLASMAIAMLLASGVALALPSSETPDPTPMVNGPVRTFAQVGDNIWVGGNFTQVKARDGSVIDNVSNVAVFDRVTGDYVNLPDLPKLGAGSTGSKVTDIKLYGNNVVIGGQFSDPSGTTKKNLVVVNGTTGQVVRWFTSPVLESVLAVPDLGRIYGGGVSLSAFDFATGKTLWSRAATKVDQSIHSHNPAAGYRDLELDTSILSPEGNPTIWAACACDDLSVSPSKTLSLLKLDTEGNRDASWVADVRASDLYGISLTQTNDTLYLGTGGSDYVAAFSKANGTRVWKMDTSGSTQVVEVMEGELVVGGHFWEVADQAADNCGFRSPNNDATLDPNDECQTRHGLAGYSFGGVLDPSWHPMLDGKYNLAWALHPEVDPVAGGTQTGRLYVGGEYLTVNGVKQNYYSRLSNDPAPPPPPACTITGTSNAETLVGTSGDDIICAGGGNDTIKGIEGNDILKGEGGADKVFGGPGDDTLDGGTGTDTVDFSGSSVGLIASLVLDTATGEGTDTLASVENLVGSSANDTLTGSDGINTINGGSGADEIVGLGGADILKGAAGNDTVDSLDGINGNDSLNGGGDRDTCITDATEKSSVKCEL